MTDSTNQVELAAKLSDHFCDAEVTIQNEPVSPADVLDFLASTGLKLAEDADGEASLAYLAVVDGNG